LIETLTPVVVLLAGRLRESTWKQAALQSTAAFRTRAANVSQNRR
jgi:hypothetical protein